jgi:hypothetical protein
MSERKKFEFGRWAVTSIALASAWPSIDETVQVADEAFHLIPQRDGYYPAVAIKLEEGASYESGWTKNNRFLSVLSWATEGVIGDTLHGGSSRYPTPHSGFERHSHQFRTFYGEAGFRIKSLPQFSSEQLISLAFWREGRCLEHGHGLGHYAYLSFFKIVERVVQPGDRPRVIKDWLSSLLSFRGHDADRARQHLEELQKEGVILEKKVRAHYRNSSAHGGLTHNAVDPDDAHEMTLRSRAAPVMKCLAYMALTERLNIPAPRELRLN